jgi:CRP-like cAMP-binding protein
VVEDNYVIANEVTHIVEDCGYKVLGPVSRVAQGIEMLGRCAVDGAIVDINLHGAFSYPLCHELKQRAVPFFFMTGYETDIIPPAFRDTQVLGKPIEHDALSAALATLMRRPEPVASDRHNLLLDALGPEDRELLWPHLEQVAFAAGDVLETPEGAECFAWFPLAGAAAVVAEIGDARADVALIGREGMIGLAAVLGASRPTYRTVARFPGQALRLPARSLAQVLEQSRSLQRHLLRYAHGFTSQLIANSAATGQATIPQRLARWLLMLGDRVGDDLAVTHAELADGLGVRRAGVTVALHELEGMHCIRSRRLRIRIVDRALLANRAEGFYV